MGQLFSKYFTKRRIAGVSLASLSLFLFIGVLSDSGLASNTQSPSAGKSIIYHNKTSASVNRLSGSNAISTSVAVSKQFYSQGVDVAYIVNRAAFADGVIASSMHAKGPILYTNTDSLPNAISTELSRLKPKRVVIVGGEIVVSSNVASQVKRAIPSTSKLERLAGANRYQTAVNVSKANYPTGSDTVYIANHSAYSDALIATQQGSRGPLLFSADTSVRSVVMDEIKRLKAKRVVILGGEIVVSADIARSIQNSTGATVSRISGNNRYDTAAALSRQLHPNGASQAYIANGTAYADSILIGSIPTPGAMLYVSDRITDATMTELQRLNPDRVTVIGGSIRVSEPIAKQLKHIATGAKVKSRLSPGLSYIVLAHPDDELASWAVADISEYPVFILATQGEASNHCLKNGGKGSQQCRDRRLSSFHQFLDNYHSVVDYGMQSGGFQLYKGQNSARLIFDLGDGNLTASEVAYAINQARSVDYGVTRENYVISGNYWDDQRDPNCAPDRSSYACGLYDHPDHRASYDAVRNYVFPNKLTFHGHYNPLVNAGVVMSKAKFDSMIACPNGTYNQAYGWLNPPCWTRENSRWHHWQWMREY